MQRQPEPTELMDDPAQALAYASADFAAPHNQFITLFKNTFPNETITGDVLDLGCGPADISIRFAQAFPECHIDGLDGAPAMLALGNNAISRKNLSHRVQLQHGYFPNVSVTTTYDTLISNSLLHHLLAPETLWDSVIQFSNPHAKIFIMDLMRPNTERDAQNLVDKYAADEPPVLVHDFHRSLLAAYTVEEVEQQLEHAKLSQLTVQAVSDRHWIVFGAL